MPEWKEYALIAGGLATGLLLACAAFVLLELVWPTPAAELAGEVF